MLPWVAIPAWEEPPTPPLWQVLPSRSETWGQCQLLVATLVVGSLWGLYLPLGSALSSAPLSSGLNSRLGGLPGGGGSLAEQGLSLGLLELYCLLFRGTLSLGVTETVLVSACIQAAREMSLEAAQF